VSYQPLLESEDYDLGIVGRSESMQAVFKMIGQVAGADASVLITGESGTGKELVARAIYHHSRRSEQPFLAINCAAIPEQLLESELFGHERGAFTGATHQRIGKFEQCHRGTVFLDEIGDMSPSTQTKLLRVLQSGTFERVGGNQTLEVDVRIIAATNRILEQAVASRQFREDLFYRLNVVQIRLPPLRERGDDIPILIDYFLKRHARDMGKSVPALAPETLEKLTAHTWPGNVRELENAVERAVVMAKGDLLRPGDLPPEVIGGPPAPASSPAPGHPGATTPVSPQDLAEALFQWARSQKNLKVIPAVERELIRQALVETGGNQVQAARLLGITRATLRKRIDKFQLRREYSVT
jgi:two-component system nitrogen regulation response regulator GlnG